MDAAADLLFGDIGEEALDQIDQELAAGVKWTRQLAREPNHFRIAGGLWEWIKSTLWTVVEK